MKYAAKRAKSIRISPTADIPSLAEDLLAGRDWTKELKAAAVNPLVAAFKAGVEAEADTTGHALVRARKATSATVLAEQLGLELPGGEQATEMPEWMLAEMSAALVETFEQPYWDDIEPETRNDIESVLERVGEDGLSNQSVAEAISAMAGADYPYWRGMRIARTETTGMLNRGHVAGIEQTSVATGIPIQKQWLSVLGTTTRPSHAAADGQTVESNGQFLVGGERTPYPGHSSMSAGNRINCQCTVISSIAAEALAPPEEEPILAELADPPVRIPPVRKIEEAGEVVSDEERTHSVSGAKIRERVIEDENGEQWRIKESDAKGETEVEAAVDELYRAAGVRVPPSRLDPETLAYVQKMVHGRRLGDFPEREQEKLWDKVFDNWGVDMLLQNVGAMDKDLLVVDANGDIWRTNQGTAWTLLHDAKDPPVTQTLLDQIIDFWFMKQVSVVPARMLAKKLGYNRAMTSAKKMLQHKNSILAKAKKLDAKFGSGTSKGMLAKLESRIKSAEDMVETSEEMTGGGWSEEAADEVTEQQAKQKQAKVFDGLNPKAEKKANELHQEAGFRGAKSVIRRLAKYAKAEGLDWKVFRGWWNALSGSLDTDDGYMLQLFVVADRKMSPKAFRWFGRKAPRSAKAAGEILRARLGDKFDEYRLGWRMLHAFFYQLLKEIELPNTDKKRRVMQVGRGENATALNSAGLERGASGLLPRRPVDSFTIGNQVAHSGDEQTYQEIPFHQILGIYAVERDPGKRTPLLFNDRETEVLAVTQEVIAARVGGKVEVGEPIMREPEWRRQIARQIARKT